MKITFVLLFLLIAIGFDSRAKSAERPNVLLLCIDDLKPTVGCYGDTLAKTPNIDELSKRGATFERAYCNQAVCSPSRNSLLTSLRSQSIGIYDLATNFRMAVPDAVTLPQYFKQHGYRTEGMGKIFHHGHGNHEDDASWSVPFWRSEVVHYALKEHADANKNSREAALFNNVGGAKAKDLAEGVAYEAGNVPDNFYPDGLTADEAIKRLENAAKSPNQPFFLAVGFVKPHLPFCAPTKYWEMYDPAKFTLAELTKPPKGAAPYAGTNWGELRNYSGMPDQGPVPDDTARTLIHGYYAATSYMDAQLGRVIEALGKTGFAKNTIIVLWGDHGWHLGDHGMWCKHTNYEQATHIPLIVIDPRAKSAGGKSIGAHTAALVESVDVYPTLCELAGLDVPQGLEGKSFAKVLSDPSAPTKDFILHAYPRGKRIGRAVRTERYRLVEWKVPGESRDSADLELYDYKTDPLERKNLASENPEVVQELRAILDKQPEAKPQLQVNADGKKGGNKKGTGAKKKQAAKSAAE